jgi:hypothetical protein
MSDFWSKDFSAGGIKDPKRKFRFIVNVAGLQESSTGTSLWYAKTATKPSFSIATTEHKYLNHTFFYPGTVTWNDVSITLVDPTDPSTAELFGDIMKAAGYGVPVDDTDWHTMTKSKLSNALGAVTITQLDGDGASMETWTLKNAIVTEMKWGDLEYGADDLTELTLTLKYDWATMMASDGVTEYFAAGQAAPTT